MDDRSTTRWHLLAGVIGPVFFVVVFLIEGWTRPGYDPTRMFVSGLSLTDAGWQQIANFVITGLLFLAAAVGWRRSMPDGPGSRWGPVLIGLAGLGLVGAGVFVTDPGYGYPPGTPGGFPTESTLHSSLHQGASILVFGGLPVAMLVMARRFRGEGSRWTAYSVASAIGMVVAFLAAFAFLDVTGLMQRLSIIIGFGWVARVSWRLRREVSEPVT